MCGRKKVSSRIFEYHVAFVDQLERHAVRIRLLQFRGKVAVHDVDAELFGETVGERPERAVVEANAVRVERQPDGSRRLELGTVFVLKLDNLRLVVIGQRVELVHIANEQVVVALEHTRPGLSLARCIGDGTRLESDDRRTCSLNVVNDVVNIFARVVDAVRVGV